MSLHTILIVEDDKVIRHLLRERLEENDFTVHEAATGERALCILGQQDIHLVLLDINLPDINGIDLLRDIRAYGNMPVMMVSGDKNVSGRVESLGRGADDYMVKPFNFDELVARMEAHLRRYDEQHANQNLKSAIICAKKLQLGPWVLDCDKFQVHDGNGAVADLTVREFRLLEHLAKNAGCALSREDLCTHVQEEGYKPTHRAIDTKVTRIRRKLGDNAAAPGMIKTVRGVGYMFDGSVEVIE